MILIIAFIDLCLALYAVFLIVAHDRGTRLFDVSLPSDDDLLPSVSLVAAARNEERNIEQAARSLLKLDYPKLEITLVNDRSTDQTGDILNRLAHEDPRLNVVHLTKLPAGWLGKNHALQLGALKSHGDWLLFTDADVILEPTTLKRAIRYAVEQDVDHLVASPHCLMPSWILQSFVVTFSYLFALFTRPWKVRDRSSDAHIGVGAFNLIRSGVYRGIGGHRLIKMRPDDDLKLGKLVKLHGFKQDIVVGRDMVFVEWYSSVREMVLGLEKNMFAGLEYSLPAVFASSALLLSTVVLPFVAPLFVEGPAQWVFAATAVIYWGLALYLARAHGLPASCALGFPLGIVMFLLIQWRAVALTYWRDGIQWRGTHYSLAELRANRV